MRQRYGWFTNWSHGLALWGLLDLIARVLNLSTPL
jgi:hypothetical protein